MKARRVTINKKIMSDIGRVISSGLCLTNVHELSDENGSKLFTDPPDQWGSYENAICDLFGRINNEITDGIEKILLENK